MSVITVDDAKRMAKRLRTALVHSDRHVTHAACLELVARQLDYPNWNVAAAQLKPSSHQMSAAIPILRIFDDAKAREFYLDFLGFSVAFEHQFETDFPIYMGIERSSCKLHLSAHYGDATPGSTAFIPIVGLSSFQDALLAKNTTFSRPGIQHLPWGDIVEISDPFGNRLRFCEYHTS